MTKAAKAAKVIPIKQLTLTGPKKAKAKLTLEGEEELASVIRSRQREIESLEAEQKIDKARLTELAASVRNGALRRGSAVATVHCSAGSDSDPVKVVFTDRYSKIDVAYREPLQEVLGDAYERYLVERCTIALRDSLSVPDLSALLGVRALEKLQTVCDINEHLECVPKLSTVYAADRSLSDEQCDAIDDLRSQCAYTPSVRTK
jgi:hypothetical protein